jgi:hypothetical protein
MYPPEDLSRKLADLFQTGNKYFYDEYFDFFDLDISLTY